MTAPERLRETLGGVTADVIADDNLAIHFCSHFEDYSGDVDDCGWTEQAVASCNAVLDTIHQHYAPALTAAIASAEKAEAETVAVAATWRDIAKRHKDRAEKADALLREAVEALDRCLNYLENTEGEFEIQLGCADQARATLAKIKDAGHDG